MALGAGSLATATVATAFTVCVLFGFTIVVIEAGLETERGIRLTQKTAALQLIRNLLLVAPALGILVASEGETVASHYRGVCEIAGFSIDAVRPCRSSPLSYRKTATSELKRCFAVGYCEASRAPVLTWFFAYHVFSMPRIWEQSAVLLSALPTDTGPFMLAEFYDREATTTSATLLFSTIGSLLTVTLCLFLLGKH